MTTLLFVYGSLQRGFANHTLLARAEFVGKASTARSFRLFELGGYAALAPGGHAAICGELYRVPRETLASLDAFEGEAYVRSELELADGTRAEAYMVAPEWLRDATLLNVDSWRER